MTPRARTAGLQVHENGGELEITVEATGEVIRLHPVSATIWRHADGSASVADLAVIARRELDVDVSEAMIWSSLDLLADHGLLDGRVAPPIAEVDATIGGELRGTDRIRRRSLLTKLGIAGGAAVVAGGLNPTSAFAKNDKENNAGGLPACKAEEETAKADAATARAEEQVAKHDAATARAEEKEAKIRAEKSAKQAQESDAKEREAKSGEQDCKNGSEEEQTKQAQEKKAKQAEEQRAKKIDQEQKTKQAQEQQSKAD